jgi:LPXTG-motif cell wall-anchored protein
VIGVRRLLVAAITVGALLLGAGIASLVAPSTSVAACAGCAQYTNPLGTTTQSATQTASQTTSSVTQTTPPVTQSAPPDTSTAGASATATTTDPEPTATAASAAAGSETTSTRALPHTGYDSWMIVGFGVALVGGGLVVRRRIRRA